MIYKINDNDIEDVLELGDNIFKGVLYDNKSYMYHATNWNISIKLVLDNKIIGFYLFSEGNIYYNDPIFENKKGVQGVALGIDKKYRGNGFGNMLINKSYELFNNDFDYIWGQHIKSLNNLEDWKKKRTIVNDTNSSFMSYKFLK